MTGPLNPITDTGSPIEDLQDQSPYTVPFTVTNYGPYANSVFMADYAFPPPGTVVVPPMPRSEGGIIQAVKTATVQSMRDALQGVSLFNKDQAIFITLDYPMEQIQFPGIWVQFSISKLNRAGIGHEITVQNPQTKEWSFIQEWTFEGRTTLTVCALKSLDRDRLADALIANLAFARTPEILLTKPGADTKKYRSLITALDENPYIALTLQLDTIIPGGQSASQGTPWGDEAALIYEDSYSFDMVGQFNIQFSQDGIYTLAEINPRINLLATGQPYAPILWQNVPDPQPPAANAINPTAGNVNTPAF